MNGRSGDMLAELGIEPDADYPLVVVSRRRFEERHRQLFSPDLQENLDTFQVPQRIQRAAGGDAAPQGEEQA
jgi:hypothetical protein